MVDEAGGVWVEPCAWAFGRLRFTGWSLTGFICSPKLWQLVANVHVSAPARSQTLLLLLLCYLDFGHRKKALVC